MNTITYAAPATLSELLGLLVRRGDEVTLIAGGMSLMPLLNRGIGQRNHLVTLGRVAGLAGVTTDGDDLVIGATTTHTDLAADTVVRERHPMLSRAAAGIGDLQVRNRGTVGGALAYANPGADELTALAALGATVVLTSTHGERHIGVADFLLSAHRTARRPDEVLSAVRVPPPSGPAGFARLGRVQGAPPTITAAAVVEGTAICLAVGGVATRPLLLTTSRDALDDDVRRAAAAAAQPITGDPMNPPEYRRAMACVLARRAVRTAIDGS
ncbi:FAD binding domain-containing protein [Streptomyces sp. NPDC059455]|uniref:FAD binding domain-containing protein n=1 Tax=Streptomyces sp. NPDC059455 TaxID=3346837 RepID=UPI0036C60C3D